LIILWREQPKTEEELFVKAIPKVMARKNFKARNKSSRKLNPACGVFFPTCKPTLDTTVQCKECMDTHSTSVFNVQSMYARAINKQTVALACERKPSNFAVLELLVSGYQNRF